MEAGELYWVILLPLLATAVGLTFAMAFVASKTAEHLPPSVSVESVSMTMVNITSDSQVKANFEVVFYPIQNPSLNNTIILYNHVNASAFQRKKLDMPIYSSETPLLDKVAVAPFEQRGGDQGRVAVQMKGVIVDIDEYEQHIHGRYGVLYLTLELRAVVETKEGKRKKTHNMRAECLGGMLKIVFLVELPWNQTKRFDFQPPNCCYVHG